MLLSRFWYFVLGLLLSCMMAAAVLALSVLQRREEAFVDRSLLRDRFELEAILKLEARSRIDALAPIAMDSEIRDWLRQAEDVQRVQSLNPRVRGRLESMNQQLGPSRVDLLFALNSSGVIVAQVGPDSARFGSSLVTFPLVDQALSGYLIDDVWLYENTVYRMAARPVTDAGRYVGAIVAGKKLDADFVKKISERIDGATLAFYVGESVFASHLGSSGPNALALTNALPPILKDPAFAKSQRSNVVPLKEEGRALYSLVTGSAAALQVGYVIARSSTAPTSLLSLFGDAEKEDLDALPWFWLVLTTLVLFGLGMLWLWLERDRPLKKLLDALGITADRPSERVSVTGFRGRYRDLVFGINKSIDKALEQGGLGAKAPKTANLDEILGETPPPPSFFSFGGEPRAESPKPPPPPPKPKMVAPPVRDMAELNQEPSHSPLAGENGAAGGERSILRTDPDLMFAADGEDKISSVEPGPIADRTLDLPNAPPAPPVAPIKRSASTAALKAATPATTGRAVGKTAGEKKPALATPPLPPAPSAMPAVPPPVPPKPPLPAPKIPDRATPIKTDTANKPPKPEAKIKLDPPSANPSAVAANEQPWEFDDDEGATVVSEGLTAPMNAPVPKAPSPAEKPAAPAAVAPSPSPDRVHAAAPTLSESEEVRFRKVYEDFVALKKECGESVKGFTFDKFEGILKKNRDDILARHGGKDVQFSVYVKEGKAALRATPVK